MFRVLFWAQPACMVQNQNTRNIYLQADDKQCSYAPKNTIPCLSRLRAERLAEKSEIPVDPMTKHFAFSRWEAGLSPSLPRAQEEGGSDTHSLTVLRPRCYLALTTMLFPSFVHGGQRQRQGLLAWWRRMDEFVSHGTCTPLPRPYSWRQRRPTRAPEHCQRSKMEHGVLSHSKSRVPALYLYTKGCMHITELGSSFCVALQYVHHSYGKVQSVYRNSRISYLRLEACSLVIKHEKFEYLQRRVGHLLPSSHLSLFSSYLFAPNVLITDID